MGGSIELSGPDLLVGVALADLPEGRPFMGHAGGEPIVLVRRGDSVSALGAACTHYGASLGDGLVTGDTIRCPWHHACFRLSDGVATGAPALDAVACYAVNVDAGRVTVGKKVPSTKAETPAVAPSSVVLVGAGAASAAAAEALRRLGYTGAITMVGDEPPSPIDRTNLSKDYLAGTAPEEWVPIRPLDYWLERKVELLVEDPAVSLDPAGKTVTLKSGRTLTYGAVMLATGAEAIRLPIEGASLPHVFTLRSLADARSVIAASSGATKAVVIGSSFIGLEAAASLRERGLEVTVVGRDRVPLARVLGEELGAFVQKLHEQHGVSFHGGASPRAIRAEGVELEDGRVLPADLVVMGVGVRPRTALAAAAGLRVEDGVVVDELLRAAPDVFAAGDIARYPEARLGQPVRIEHWVVAQRHGQAIARTMLGLGTPFRDVPYFWSQHYDLTISYVGHARTWDALEVTGSIESRDATLVYRSAGRTLAVVTLGRDLQSLAVEAALEAFDERALAEALSGSGSR